MAESVVGRRVRCPSCDQLVEVTVAEPAEEPAPDPAPEVVLDVEPVAAAAPGAATETAAEEEEGEVLQVGGSRLTDNEIDMTPMVDVVFQLLIFFMLTAAFSLQKSIEIPKPQETDQPSTQFVQVEDNPELVTIIVDEFSTFQVITPEIEKECPSQQELLVQLREAKSGGGGTAATKVLVKAHGDALHERVVIALDSATSLGFEEVQLTSYEEEP